MSENLFLAKWRNVRKWLGKSVKMSEKMSENLFLAKWSNVRKWLGKSVKMSEKMSENDNLVTC